MLSRMKREVWEKWSENREDSEDWAVADKYIIYGMRRMCYGDKWFAKRL